MKTKLLTVAAMLALLAPAAAMAEAPVAGTFTTPAQILGQALAGKRQALEACGVRWTGAGTTVTVHFKLNFQGGVANLKVDGLPATSSIHRCLVKEFSSLRVPVRLSFIVRQVSFPLKVAAVVSGKPALASR